MEAGVIAAQSTDGLSVFTLAGELDFACAAALRHQLTTLPDASRPDVVLDLRRVTFIDCSAVGALVALTRAVVEAGGCVRLVGAQAAPLRVLQLCKLEAVLCFYDSLSEATVAVCPRHRANQTSPPGHPPSRSGNHPEASVDDDDRPG